MRAWWLLIGVVVLGLWPWQAQAGDRLDAARSQARSSSGRSSSGRSSSSSSYDDDDDDDGGIVLAILGALFDDDDDDAPSSSYHSGSASTWDPQISIPDDKRGFLPYPYAGRRDGYMVRAAPGESVPDDTRHVVFHAAAEGAYLYEDVWRTSAQLRFMLPRFYTQFRYDFLLEGPTPRLDGDVELEGTVRDRLHFTTLELGPQLFAGELLAVRFGLVGNLMFDDRRSLPEEPTSTPGIGAAASFDLYPIRPLVFSGRGSVMRLGNTVYLEGRATVGVSLNRVEIFAGYDHRMVGDVPLGGPTAGVAVRF